MELVARLQPNAIGRDIYLDKKKLLSSRMFMLKFWYHMKAHFMLCDMSGMNTLSKKLLGDKQYWFLIKTIIPIDKLNFVSFISYYIDRFKEQLGEKSNPLLPWLVQNFHH